MGRLFGTDGIRGIVGEDLSCELVLKIGKATAYVLKKHCKEKNMNILIGKDTRISGYMLEAAFVAGLSCFGVNCYLAGVVPTPLISLLVNRYKFQAGVMISASHNPYIFNGIKIFNQFGFKISDDVENEIERCVFGLDDDFLNYSSFLFGKSFFCKKAVSDYVDYLVSTVDGVDCSNLKIAVDCANGSAYAMQIF